MESRKHPRQIKANSMKTLNSLQKCTCLRLVFDSVRKTCTKWLQLNISFSESAVEGVFIANMKALLPSIPFMSTALYANVCLFWFVQEGESERQWDALHSLIFGAYLYVHTLTPFSSFGWLNTWVASTWNANFCHGWMKSKHWKTLDPSQTWKWTNERTEWTESKSIRRIGVTGTPRARKKVTTK